MACCNRRLPEDAVDINDLEGWLMGRAPGSLDITSWSLARVPRLRVLDQDVVAAAEDPDEPTAIWNVTVAFCLVFVPHGTGTCDICHAAFLAGPFKVPYIVRAAAHPTGNSKVACNACGATRTDAMPLFALHRCMLALQREETSDAAAAAALTVRTPYAVDLEPRARIARALLDTVEDLKRLCRETGVRARIVCSGFKRLAECMLLARLSARRASRVWRARVERRRVRLRIAIPRIVGAIKGRLMV